MRRETWKAIAVGLSSAAFFVACGWDPKKPFERYSPDVDRAAADIDSGRPREAQEKLKTYIGASACDGGAMTVLNAADASNATFDLGLTLFKLAEQYGRKLDDAVVFKDGGPGQEDKQLDLARGDQLDCAKAVLDAILSRDMPVDLEARARYLRGNVAFLDRNWQSAIEDYDKALSLIPGLPIDAGDGIGRDAAHNRALALRFRDEEQKRDGGADADADGDADGDADADAPDGPDADADADAPKDAPQDQDGDAPNDAEGDGAPQPNEDGGKDGGDGNDKPDGGKGDGGKEAGAPRSDVPQGPGQDERMLDMFEQAPTFQREESKSRGNARKMRGSQDK